jgi:hypothetical protein
MPLGTLLAALVLLGPRAQFSGSPSPQQTYAIRGTVLNAATGEPIHGALVQVFSERQRSQLTGPGGEFQFDNVLQGTYGVRVQKPGFFFPPELPTSRGQPIMISVGADQPPAVIKLVPEGLIFGRVTGDNGEPIESLPVQLLFDRIENGRRTLAPARGASTDEQGEFRLADLQPGRYFVFFGPSSGSGSFSERPSPLAVRGYPATFYPGVPDIASAAAIEITPGKHTEIRLSLSSQPFYRISGTVSGFVQNQGIDVQIINAAGQPAGIFVRFDPARGVFRSQWVPAGTYTLAAHMQDPATQQEYSASQDVHLASDLAGGVHLALAPSTSIFVNFRIESTRNDSPLTQTHTFFSGGSSRMRQQRQAPAQVLLSPRNQPASQQQRSSEPAGDEENAAVVRNVPPGVYSVEVQPFGPYYPQLLRAGALNLLEQNLTVSAGASLPPIEVVLRDDFATLEGSVTSNGLGDSATILVIPEGASQQVRAIGLMRSPAADTNRSAVPFTMPPLPPGNYKVLAVDSPEFEYGNPEVLQKYLSRAREVYLLPNQKAEVKLELVHIGD